MTRPRKWLRAIAFVVLCAVLAVTGVVLRATVFAPRFDVPSIRERPEYQDATLLARAWDLPSATTFGRRVDYQTNPSVCGPTSVANVLRSLGEGGASAPTTRDVLDGSGKCATGLCINGLTLDEVASLLGRKTTRKIRVLRDLPLDAFRDEMRRANDPARRVVVNFHRGLLFGKGTGHHSPIGGYLEDVDLVFVLDVNGSFGPWLVATERLYRAVDSIDGSSGRKRGLIVIEAPSP
jgi:phytochelatin synthase